MHRLIGAAAAAVAVALAGAGAALGFGGAQLDAKACGGGKLAVNVVQAITNDADSGVAGNVWAFDDLTRQIQVWQTGATTFCAIVRYEGTFTTNAGASPGGSGAVSAGIRGQFDGGYRTTQFTATLAPTKPTHGFIGRYDYACDLSFDCPGYVDWTSFYFTGVSGYDLAWWGWQYRAGANGTWVNSVDGNSGDITGAAGPGRGAGGAHAPAGHGPGGHDR